MCTVRFIGNLHSQSKYRSKCRSFSWGKVKFTCYLKTDNTCVRFQFSSSKNILGGNK